MKYALLAAAAATAAAQEQIHLSLTGLDTEMAVSWAYTGDCSSSSPSTLTYGVGSASRSVAATGTYFDEADLCLFNAVMTDLPKNTAVTYSIDGSSSFTFTNQPERDGGRIYAVFADFGYANDVSMSQLISEAQNDQYDAIIHAGDFAYDLNEGTKSSTGNSFMNAFQPAVAIKPWMGCPGNHEADIPYNAKSKGDAGSWDDNSNQPASFAQYKNRFSAFQLTANRSESTNMMWYSFNDGLVHFVSIDTEMWYYAYNEAQLNEMYDWFATDLAKVDRSVTPWVVLMGHKQGWMDKVYFDPFNKAMHDGKVDLMVLGHVHNYERLYPLDINNNTETDCVSGANNNIYTDCQNPVSIIVGSPGCKENLSSLQAPTGIIQFDNTDFGYAHLQVHNATHMSWGWETIGQRDAKGRYTPKVGAFADTAMFVKTSRA